MPLIDDFNYGNKLLSITREKTAQLNALIIAAHMKQYLQTLYRRTLPRRLLELCVGRTLTSRFESLMKSIQRHVNRSVTQGYRSKSNKVLVSIWCLLRESTRENSENQRD